MDNIDKGSKPAIHSSGPPDFALENNASKLGKGACYGFCKSHKTLHLLHKKIAKILQQDKKTCLIAFALSPQDVKVAAFFSLVNGIISV